VVKEQGNAKQQITGLLLEGTLLRLMQVYENGDQRTVLVSAQTGEPVYEGDHAAGLVIGGDTYSLMVDSGPLTEWLWGTETEGKVLWPAGEQFTAYPLPDMKAAVTVRQAETGLQIDYYDVATGLRSASVLLEGMTQLDDLTADADGGVLWLRCGKTLYRWTPASSPTGDETVYTEPRYTREQPDENGLAELETLAGELEQRYQVELLLWNDAEGAAPQGSSFETEYFTRVYRRNLAVLDGLMAQFPDNFFQTAGRRSANGKVTISLVRNITGTQGDTRAQIGGIQYWMDESMYIALSMDDKMESSFYHAIGHVIETCVLSTSAKFYEWHKLNPQGFQYDNDYIANLDRQDQQYLTEENRWFIDMFSMSFAGEDRSRIFEYASTAGNEAYFSTQMMQNKLRRVCEGIREAFGAKNDPRQFVWEQYLK